MQPLQAENFHIVWKKRAVINFGYLLKDLPKINDRRNRTMKIANRIFAIEAAPEAIPPKPKIAAMIAMTKKVIVQRNIVVKFRSDYNLYRVD